MARRSWLSIRVDLVSGRGRDLWPRPGRLFAAARTHTFAQLATAIDDAFARWDRAHLHEFRFPLTTGPRWTYHRIGLPDPEWDDDLGPVDDMARTRLSRLTPNQAFVYVFDFGDDWTHLCTVGPERIDPEEALGLVPDRPLPYFGWGDIPDQYGRRWDGDTGEDEDPPPDPRLGDLPPLEPWWGDQGPEDRRSPE
jgi:hypothetical protein